MNIETTKQIRIIPLIICLIIPLAVGGISSLLTSDAMVQYRTMRQPPLSPPGWLFPVVWTILYAVMGISCYLVLTDDTASGLIKNRALILYAAQLLLNFVWPILFFRFSLPFPAFLWILVLWLMILVCAFDFYRIRKLAGLLMLPYALWTTFAAYLNLGSYLVNRK